ncbi:IS21 family transposase [Sinomonas terrae]|uniref:IS21 family transposase n=1 Tax=Sinomonas terrae TaxID=2908838 RepID=UPI0025B68944|nr:IS21 family transposase [Sinomonas terrae]
MKSNEEIMEILEAYDLTGSYRAAAELAGCDHHTVARYVKLRAAGGPDREKGQRARPIDGFLPKIEELVERSGGRVRADVVHERLVAMGFTGAERTTRRTVAEAKAQFAAGRRRVFRPWIVEPGLWLQWDYGWGPRIGGRATLLWCAWLAWSRFRVVIPIWDKSLPTVVACMDATLRRMGGVPAFALTDNERTVTADHIARVAVRNPQIVEMGRHYGMTVRTCVPADPQSKGGSESTVRISKADLVPTAANLLEEYRTFGQLEKACHDFCDEVNARPHRETRQAPAAMLAAERERLHLLPKAPFTVVFGTTRRVNWDATVSMNGVRYSVPHELANTRVWVREAGEEVIVTSVAERGEAREVARHATGRPGTPVLDDAHYPPRADEAADRQPRATTPEEAAFLMLGAGAKAWLVEAAAAGARRIRAKMAEAVAFAKLYGTDQVDRALGTAATTGRFADRDLVSILGYQAGLAHVEPSRASEAHSLQPGTGGWGRLDGSEPAAADMTGEEEGR